MCRGEDGQHILSSRSMCVYRIGLGVLSTDARFIVTILKVFNTHWCAAVRTKLLHKTRLQFIVLTVQQTLLDQNSL